MKRNVVFGLTFLTALGTADLLTVGVREARAQLLGAPADGAVWPAGYYKVKVRGRGNAVTVRERGYAVPVTGVVPTVVAVPTTSFVESPVVATTRVVETVAVPAPVVTSRVVTPVPVVERQYITAAPLVTRRVLTPVPVLGPPVVTYGYPY